VSELPRVPSGPAPGAKEIDGVKLETGDRILFMNQRRTFWQWLFRRPKSNVKNGIYEVRVWDK